MNTSALSLDLSLSSLRRKDKEGRRKVQKGVIAPKAVSVWLPNTQRFGRVTPSRAAESVIEKDQPVGISQAITKPVTVEMTQQRCDSRTDKGGVP